MLELYFLLILMILGAVVAVEVKSLLSSIIAVGAAGVMLSAAFLVLKAPDLAITQLVVEILCLVILIRATIRRDLPGVKGGSMFLKTAAAALFIAVFLSFASACLKELPAFGLPAMKVAKDIISDGMAKTGAANMVTSVILDFRAYDTLGEATVLFTAVLGVLTVMRRAGRKKPGGGAKDEE